MMSWSVWRQDAAESGADLRIVPASEATTTATSFRRYYRSWPVRTLVYKRTHHGDPDSFGRFGIHDCMGRVRAWDFDAVVGVGGYGSVPTAQGLAGKVNWIGIGAHRTPAGSKRGPIVTFDHFVLYGSDGPDFARLAPRLADRMYANNVRVILNGLDAIEQAEVEHILARARRAPPSGSVESSRPTGSARSAWPCGKCEKP